jgi:hypothetical protein
VNFRFGDGDDGDRDHGKKYMFAFGAGRDLLGSPFGHADSTCGLLQDPGKESARGAITEGFGRRADRDDHKTARPIKEGSRLALQLSARGADGTRTARFFVDVAEVAAFADIEDDGGGTDWVAGVILSNNARVRLVPAEGYELLFTEGERQAAQAAAAEKVKRSFEEVVGGAEWPGELEQLEAERMLQEWSVLVLRDSEPPTEEPGFVRKEEEGQAMKAASGYKFGSYTRGFLGKLAGKEKGDDYIFGDVSRNVLGKLVGKEERPLTAAIRGYLEAKKAKFEKIAAAKAAGWAVAWDRKLSDDELIFGDDDATVTGPPDYVMPALVPVPRIGAVGFPMAVLIEAMDEDMVDYISFGVGRKVPSRKWGMDRGTAGLHNIIACGMHSVIMGRMAATEGFGRAMAGSGGGSGSDSDSDKYDSDSDKYDSDSDSDNHENNFVSQSFFGIDKQRLALHLSPRGAHGTRTVRFFADGSEVAVFADIEDDGSDSDWVAGVRVPAGTTVRLVPAAGEELIPFLTKADKKAATAMELCRSRQQLAFALRGKTASTETVLPFGVLNAVCESMPLPALEVALAAAEEAAVTHEGVEEPEPENPENEEGDPETMTAS